MIAIASPITSLTIVYSTVLFRRRSKKTSKLRVTGLCEGNSPVTGEFPTQRASNAENVSIWWRHHALLLDPLLNHFNNYNNQSFEYVNADLLIVLFQEQMLFMSMHKYHRVTTYVHQYLNKHIDWLISGVLLNFRVDKPITLGLIQFSFNPAGFTLGNIKNAFLFSVISEHWGDASSCVPS